MKKTLEEVTLVSGTAKVIFMLCWFRCSLWHRNLIYWQVSWLEMLGRAGAVIPRIYFLLGVKARPWVTLWMRLAVGVEAGWKLDRKETEFKEI